MLSWQDFIQLGDNKAPGVATDLVHTALAKGKGILEGVTKGHGCLGWAVGKAELPVAVILNSGIGKAVVTVGQRFVKLADRTVDGTINSAVFKRSGDICTDTYTNRVLPVTTAVSTKLNATSAHVRSAVVSAKDKVASTLHEVRPANLNKITNKARVPNPSTNPHPPHHVLKTPTLEPCPCGIVQGSLSSKLLNSAHVRQSRPYSGLGFDDRAHPSHISICPPFVRQRLVVSLASTLLRFKLTSALRDTLVANYTLLRVQVGYSLFHACAQFGGILKVIPGRLLALPSRPCAQFRGTLKVIPNAAFQLGRKNLNIFKDFHLQTAQVQARIWP